MFLEIVISMLFGIVLGTVTGLIPGIHPNTIFTMIVFSGTGISLLFHCNVFLVFIMSLAVSNTFTDFLPSMIFGAPDPSTVLSVLPGHKFLLMGDGYYAIALTVVGGLGVALLTVLTLPILIYILPSVYFTLRPYLHIILISLVFWMVLGERGWCKIFSLLAFLLSGILGVITLNSFPGGSMLFPSLTGLFAMGTLLTSYYTKSALPPQKISDEIPGDHRRGILSGWLAGWFAGMLPGVGASQAAVFVAQAFKAKATDFITALGGINTSNIMFTFVMFYVLGKTRSGAVWAISQFVGTIGLWDMLLLIFVGITVCFISAIITLFLARLLLKYVRRINYNKLTLFVAIFLIFMVAVLSGIPGIISMSTGTFIGILAIKKGIRRSHMMGYLLLPTIIYFSGLSPFMMLTLGF
jgi:putative membrane protein